ncbi:RNA polymerase sigma-70 factor [Mucilaginibacter pedocola]|uniref:RNA polymerase subunit sigma-70 n=1 Tax=Mucilaginibacter pedocola TaxID=1792845 RepID=A0A1S9P9T6_9SPHI|nr:RNA polymerase sigma-70 factor [Mucilaginibacter pedocola]OOQ57711.1 RNA polymerase subunit sigma-70 [Mucilaginibacter pedocola]
MVRPYRNTSDNDLFLLLAESDERALAEIYDRYWAVLYLYATKFSWHADGAEDIVQDVFIDLWNRAPELDLNSSLSAYLYAAVRYKIFDLLDHEKVKEKHLASLSAFLEKQQATPDSAIIEKELANQIELAIEALPAKMREVFELSRKNGLSQKEIALHLNISDKTVKKQVSNAIKILRLKLGTLISVLLFF